LALDWKVAKHFRSLSVAAVAANQTTALQQVMGLLNALSGMPATRAALLQASEGLKAPL
jgi:hypothetical protein